MRRRAPKSSTACSSDMENPWPTSGRSMTSSCRSIWATPPNWPIFPLLQRKELTLRTLANRALLAAKRATVLFAVEDAHWIDPSTNELLRDIVLRMPWRAHLRADDPSSRLVAGLGEGPLARDQRGRRPPDQPADTPVHPIDPRRGLRSSRRPDRRTDGRRAAFRRGADPFDPRERRPMRTKTSRFPTACRAR